MQKILRLAVSQPVSPKMTLVGPISTAHLEQSVCSQTAYSPFHISFYYPVIFLTLDQPKHLCLACAGVPAGRQGNELWRSEIENIFKFVFIKLDQTSNIYCRIFKHSVFGKKFPGVKQSLCTKTHNYIETQLWPDLSHTASTEVIWAISHLCFWCGS